MDPNYLEFEQPIAELEAKISELRLVGSDNEINISQEIQNLKDRILNILGEELINENIEQFIGEYTKQLNLSNNAKGIYFLEIETKDGIINKKLILQ